MCEINLSETWKAECCFTKTSSQPSGKHLIHIHIHSWMCFYRVMKEATKQTVFLQDFMWLTCSCKSSGRHERWAQAGGIYKQVQLQNQHSCCCTSMNMGQKKSVSKSYEFVCYPKIKCTVPESGQAFTHGHCCAELLREIELADLSGRRAHMKASDKSTSHG